MTFRQKAKIAILKSLLACDGTPMPEDAMVEAARQLCVPRLPRAEIEIARAELEAEGFICGLADQFCGTSWTLSEKGKHQASQL